MNNEQEHVVDDSFRKQLYATMAQEASGLYSQLLTICTAFLGGSLTFYEKLAPNPLPCSMLFLFLAWLSFIYSLLALIWVRWKNVEAHRMILESLKGDECLYDKARKTAIKTRRVTNSIIVSIGFGMSFLALFVFINSYQGG
jgi:hypothetical protein